MVLETKVISGSTKSVNMQLQGEPEKIALNNQKKNSGTCHIVLQNLSHDSFIAKLNLW